MQQTSVRNLRAAAFEDFYDTQKHLTQSESTYSTKKLTSLQKPYAPFFNMSGMPDAATVLEFA